MQMTRKFIFMVGALVMGLGIHASAALAASPEQVVTDFSKAFFMQDPIMETYLAEAAKVTSEEKNAVEVYFDQLEKRAVNEGYKPSYYKMSLSQVKAEVLSSDKDQAKVLITAIKKRNINGLYKVVGDIFAIQDEHKLEEIVTLVNEDGNWKIAAGTYGLPR